MLNLLTAKSWLTPGQVWMIYAVIFFIITHASVKELSHLPFFELVFFRALISVALCWFSFRKSQISPWGVDKKNLILRGLSGTFALTLYFFVLQRMPLATAVTLQYLSPIFTIIFAALLLKERFKPIQAVFFIMAFVGVVMVKGFDPRVSLFNLVMGVLSAAGSGVAYTLVRKLKDTDDPMVVVFYFPLVTLPLMLPFVIYYWQTPQWSDLPWILAIGVFTQLAQIYMTKALQAEKAVNVTLFNYLGMGAALGLGYFYFDEAVSLISLLGMLVILTAIYLNVKFTSR